MSIKTPKTKTAAKPKPLFEPVQLPKLEQGEEYLIFVDTGETGPDRVIRCVAAWCFDGRFQQRAYEGARREPPAYPITDVKKIYRLPPSE